jgi:ribosomal protein S12 methylthiotransferase accessory factor
VYFPVNLLANLYASNGLSAGNSPAEARVQGLSEIFERYAKNRIIAQRLALPDIPQTVLEKWPTILDAKASLEAQGYRLLLKDASLGGRYPVINVTLVDVQSGRCLASFGAHPQFSVALERTLTELFQGRSLESLDGFRAASLDAEYVASHENLETHFIDSAGLIHVDFFGQTPDFAFVEWDFSGSTQREFDTLIGLLAQEDKVAYIADFEHLGFYACRIVVPGMSEIYPPDELTWHNRNEARAVREHLVSLADLSASERTSLWEAMQTLSVADHARVSEWLGLLQDKDSPWKDMRFGELKAYLACWLGDLEEGLAWMDWCEGFDQIPAARQNLLRSLALQITAELERQPDYHDTARLLYGQCVVDQAALLLAGSWIWPSLTGSKSHEKLMRAKDKLVAYKERHYVRPVV